MSPSQAAILGTHSRLPGAKQRAPWGLGVRLAFRAKGRGRTPILRGASMPGYEAYGRTMEAGLVQGIAQALRAEFGISIDSHPGGPGNEAGVVNRAFLACARRILGSIVPRGEDLEAVLTCVLRTAALERLAEVGVVARRAEALIDQQPGLGNAWLAFVALVPEVVIKDLVVGHEDGT